MVPSSGAVVSVPPGVLPSYQQSQMLAQAQVPNLTSVAPSAAPTENIHESQSGGTVTVHLQDTEAALDADKRAIYRHPLYPLLNLLFEKCEQATQTPDCPSSESFGMDIQQFVHQQERDRKPFFSEDPDLDSLMMKAIQVLRIHLLELEKVNELCKDFCSRYMSCLKGKLQSENLLRIEGSEFDMSPPSTPQPQNVTMQQVMTSVAGNNVVIQQGIPQPAVTMATINQGQLVSGGTVYQMVQTPQGIVAQPVQLQTAPVQTAMTPGTPIIHGSTPLSQIGVVTTSATPGTPSVTAQFSLPTTPTSPIDDDDPLGKKKNKRGVLPKSATQVMRSWLFQHIVHPYPSEDEKRQIAGQTNLTLLQVNNWFINARRRILQPMLDSSNPDQNKAKKSRPQNRPVQRFWPESIANIQPQLSSPTHAVPSEGEELEPDQVEVTLSTSTGEIILTSAEGVISQQPIFTTAAGQHIQQHPIILPAVLTADGQVISTTSALNLASLQGSQLTSVLGQVPQVTQVLVQNGAEGLQPTSNDSELALDNSDSSSLAE